jgi:hypothetical protein
MSAYFLTRDEMIVSPGKFEGCPEWAPYFHLAECDRWRVDNDHIEWCVIDVTDEDRKLYPVLRDAHRVLMREDEQGFVHVMLE